MQKIVYFLISAALFIGCKLSDSADPLLLWADEFQGTGSPDPLRWTYQVGNGCPQNCGWGNNELQYYSENRVENARLENGRLIIEAHKEDFEESAFTSARLSSFPSGSWQYAYVEVRAKLPEGLGTWPAIWMLPVDNRYGKWPKSGEIDIMEHVGYDPGVIHGTVHTQSFNHIHGTEKGAQKIVPGFADDFHVYAMNWTPKKIEFFVDDVKYHEFVNTGQNSDDWPFDQPFYLLLNVAVGGNWGGRLGVAEDIWPKRMEVDYVRVYAPRPHTPTTTP
jgi:beta-glucanase (GH16 family)